MIVAHDKANGLYAFEYGISLPLFINGKEAKVFHVRPYHTSGRICITIEEPKQLYYFKEEARLVGYSGPETLSVEEFQAKKTELLSKGREVEVEKYDGDYETEMRFDNLEDEVAYNRFIRDYQPLRVKISSKVNIEFTIVEKPVSEYSEIIPMNSLPDIISTKKCLCDFYATPIKYLADICEKRNIKFTNADHSGIEFAQIDNNYIFGRQTKQEFKSLISGGNRTGNYQELVELRTKFIKYIEDTVDNYLLRNKQVDCRGTYKLLQDMFSYIGQLSEIEVKSKSYAKWAIVRNKLDELVESIKEKILDDNRE